jgi:hypothetical protein
VKTENRKKGTKDRPFIPQSIMHMPKANITRAAICKKNIRLLGFFLKKNKNHVWSFYFSHLAKSTLYFIMDQINQLTSNKRLFESSIQANYNMWHS